MRTDGWTYMTYSVTSQKTTYEALHPFWWTDFPTKEGTYHSQSVLPSSWPVCCELTSAPCQGSSLGCRAVWTHFICSQSCWVSLCVVFRVIAVQAKRCFSRHWLKPCSASAGAQVCWGQYPDNLHAGVTHGLWLWEAYCLHRGLSGHGGVVLAWSLHVCWRRWWGMSPRWATTARMPRFGWCDGIKLRLKHLWGKTREGNF